MGKKKNPSFLLTNGKVMLTFLPLNIVDMHLAESLVKCNHFDAKMLCSMIASNERDVKNETVARFT
jgi:hypothetical protein